MRIALHLTLVAIGLLVAGSSTAPAAEPADKASIEKLIKATRQKEQYEKSTMGAIQNSMTAMSEQVPEEKQASFKAATERIMKLMDEKLSWDSMSEQIVEIYAAEFTQEEIEAVLPHIESEAMQTYLKKTSQLGPKIAKIGSEKASELQPQILQIIQEEMSK